MLCHFSGAGVVFHPRTQRPVGFSQDLNQKQASPLGLAESFVFLAFWQDQGYQHCNILPKSKRASRVSPKQTPVGLNALSDLASR